ncbi:MAG TPA: thioredoxin [Actinomycetota bacterium]|nr:thioredoxin [Actinomycetota bacterium]
MGLTTKVVRGDTAERLLVLMHGLGSNELDLASLAPIIDPDGAFVVVSPRAPYAYGPGFSWFRMEAPDTARLTMGSSLDAVDDVVESALAEYDMKRDEMIVGGFSMGGAMALGYTFRPSEKERPAGVLVMSGFISPDSIELDWTGKLPPVLMQHGTNDPMVRIDRARAAAKILQENNVPLMFREYPMQHNVTPESARDAMDWLGQIRRGEVPRGIEVQVSAPEPESDGPVGAVSSATFDREVLQADKPVIVDFWAPWCGPCRAVAPVVEQIATMRGGAYKVVKCNIDESPDIAQRYDVKSIPLVALFRNGRMERASLGAKPRQQLEAELGMLVIP